MDRSAALRNWRRAWQRIDNVHNRRLFKYLGGKAQKKFRTDAQMPYARF